MLYRDDCQEGTPVFDFLGNNEKELTLYTLMDSSFWFDAINLVWFIVCIKGSRVIFST